MAFRSRRNKHREHNTNQRMAISVIWTADAWNNNQFVITSQRTPPPPCHDAFFSLAFKVIKPPTSLQEGRGVNKPLSSWLHILWWMKRGPSPRASRRGGKEMRCSGCHSCGTVPPQEMSVLAACYMETSWMTFFPPMFYLYGTAYYMLLHVVKVGRPFSDILKI